MEANLVTSLTSVSCRRGFSILSSEDMMTVLMWQIKLKSSVS